MKSSDMINKIRTLLDLDVKLEELKLENGTVLEAESFEKGKEVFIKTEDEKVAMPVGEYSLENGQVLLVEQEGIIADVKNSDEKPEEVTEDLEDDKEKKGYNMEEKVKEMDERISKIEMALQDMMPKEEEEVEAEAEVEEQKPLKSRTVKEEFSKPDFDVDGIEVNKEKEEEKQEVELSEPATQPIKHSPEGGKKKAQHLYAQKRRMSIKDRVLDRIVNN
tara:strand:+ start:132 stop:791 length:660 start_codon:yes stop_codon:yes gene_type:complete